MKEEYEELKDSAWDLTALESDDPLSKPSEEGDTKDKCRACTRLLFETKHSLLETSELLELFKRLSTTEISSDDILPKSICPECFQHLKSFERFQEKCIASYKTLLLCSAQILKQANSVSYTIPTDPIVKSGSNQKNRIEFEEVVVPEIKVENECSKCLEDETINATEAKYDSDNCIVEKIDSHKEKRKRKTAIKRKREKNKRKKDNKVDNDTCLYKCEKCDSEFNSEIQYSAHLRKHEGKKPYPCQLCPREYCKFALYEQHMALEHSGKTPTFECTVTGCGKICRTQRAFTQHMNKHANILPKTVKIMCEICGKYLTTSAMKNHKLMHNGETPHACDQCPKKFYTIRALESHKLIHTDIRPHTCPLCGLKSRCQKDAAQHFRNHNREKKHSCELCVKMFYTKDHLRRHTNSVHIGIKQPQYRRKGKVGTANPINLSSF